jgi:hypothetical protein
LWKCRGQCFAGDREEQEAHFYIEEPLGEGDPEYLILSATSPRKGRAVMKPVWRKVLWTFRILLLIAFLAAGIPMSLFYYG